jgi:oligopeptide transport system ATP-binding protein
MTTTAPILEVRNLTKVFDIPGAIWRKAQQLRAVDDVSFTLTKGTTLGIVGESGSGKSTVANMIMGLVPPTSGEILLNGRPLSHSSRTKDERRALQMVFQDPYSSLNSRMQVQDIIAEPLRSSGRYDRRQIAARVDALLDMVNLPASAKERFPHSFSGGQRQRIVIARALALDPEVLICDEAVSALDVSIQSQILNLLRELQDELGLTYIFIGHGLETVYFMSDEVMVMYLGKVVENAPAEALYGDARHPYTRALLEVAGSRIPFSAGGDVVLGGEIPSPMNPPSGCAFRTRCPVAVDACADTAPALTVQADGHQAACLLTESGSSREERL